MDPINMASGSLTMRNLMKQLKSSSQDLRELFERSITVRHVVEELQCCQADDDAAVVRKRMEELDFDILGMEEKGVIHGYVERSSLETGPCRKYQQTFHPSELIAESTPLIDLLPILCAAARVFVLDRNRVSGIVTRGDLQKAPVRMLLFGLVTLLEMHLLHLVQIHYPQDSWQKCLKGKRLESAKNLLTERRARNEAIDLADCLQLCDKRELILRSRQIRERIGLKSKKSGERLLKSAEDLRNRLAHARDIVTGSSWPTIINLAKEIEGLLERCEAIEIGGYAGDKSVLRGENMPPTAQDFQKELGSIFALAQQKARSYVDVKSGDLHRRVGGYPGHNHRMPVCCEVMKRNMRSGDKILQKPLSGQGATLIIRYKLPR